jgi:Tol biopolymer transport system component
VIRLLALVAAAVIGNPAISPDGRQVAYSVGGGAHSPSRLVVRDLAGGVPRTVFSIRDSCCDPIAYAQQRRIVFVSDYRLESVDTTTRKATLLFGDASRFILSPNRETVAFDDGCACGHAPDAIGLVDAAGGKVTVIAKPKTATDTIDGFSPDGTELVFTRSHFDRNRGSSGPRLMVQRLRGGTPVPLSRSALIGSSRLPSGANDPQWSPDGNWIAFERAGRLEVVRTTGAGSARDLAALPRFTPFSWSPTSKRLAYVAYKPNLERLATVDLDGHPVVIDHPYVNGGDRPQWSHDGAKLVFMGPAGSGVWIVAADGRGLRKLA